jgi:hypothetical protein
MSMTCHGITAEHEFAISTMENNLIHYLKD